MVVGGTFSISPRSVPKQIDFKITAEGEPVTGHIGKTIRGIIEVQGDTLRLCAGEKTRPKSFTEKKEAVVVFERVKR